MGNLHRNISEGCWGDSYDSIIWKPQQIPWLQKRVKIPDVSVGWLEEYFLQATWSSRILWWSVSYIFPHTHRRFGKNESWFGWHGGGKSGSQLTKGATMRSLRCSLTPSTSSFPATCNWQQTGLLKKSSEKNSPNGCEERNPDSVLYSCCGYEL